MTTDDLIARVDRWAAGSPRLGAGPHLDAATLAGYVALGEALLAGLPAKPDRDQRQQRLAGRVLDTCRAVRDRFITLHAEQVHAELTGNGANHHRLAELVAAAAERFPGLVPTKAQLDAERERAQSDKEGREIDQGIFIRGLLRSATAGDHLIDAMRRASPRALGLLDGFRRTGRVELGTVLVERRGSAAHLTIHNEHCLNAEDDVLVDDLETAVDLALIDDAVRVGVLRGGVMTHPKYRGRRVFNAGINLAALRDGRISLVDFLLRRELGFITKLIRGVLVEQDPAGFAERAKHKPWVAVVDTFAIGGGTQLLLAMDWVIAADDAYFSLPAAREGIVPGAANLRLTRATGSRLSRQLILAGRTISATEPAAGLLCDEVLPATEIDAAVDAATRFLDSDAVIANRYLLHLAEEPPDRFRAYLAEFAVSQAVRLYSDDVIAKVELGWSGRRGEAVATTGS
jgi:(3,5-dihydroxyphenyl)acetyl-CoA 1,2-dioxygenase